MRGKRHPQYQKKCDLSVKKLFHEVVNRKRFQEIASIPIVKVWRYKFSLYFLNLRSVLIDYPTKIIDTFKLYVQLNSNDWIVKSANQLFFLLRISNCIDEHLKSNKTFEVFFEDCFNTWNRNKKQYLEFCIFSPPSPKNLE